MQTLQPKQPVSIHKKFVRKTLSEETNSQAAKPNSAQGAPASH
jgi:hypothetical protein